MGPTATRPADPGFNDSEKNDLPVSINSFSNLISYSRAAGSGLDRISKRVFGPGSLVNVCVETWSVAKANALSAAGAALLYRLINGGMSRGSLRRFAVLRRIL